MYDNLPDKPIICVDATCFYASCIAMLENLDVMTVPIAVVGNLNQAGSVVLAASPAMKKRFGVKTGTRKYEIPKHPDIRLYEPKMSFFLEMSMAITRLISDFVPPEAIHVYSVDESFVNLEKTNRLWGSPEDTAQAIRQAIYNQFRIRTAVGMGPNMLLAKLALDLEAKKTGFAKWTYEDVPKKLWPVQPLSKMWGIGKQMESNFNQMGIYSVRDLANTDLKRLERAFGVMGTQYYYHARGVDLSNFGEPLLSKQLSFGKGQMLMKDYNTRKEILVVILEMTEDIARKARESGYAARTLTLGLSYSKHAMTKGFYRSKTLKNPTSDTMELYAVCQELLDKYFAGEPARQLSVRITNLEPERNIQLDLFDGDKVKRKTLAHTMDHIRERFGATSLLRAASFTKSGTAIQREQLIGGHSG
ncbi:Y-family DNA polymerase [Viridibacillus arvi]|uniref:Y-family DNA polymerase n=1 Tax=Viridibacillus arvi TaxID=263475 RepID=UPI0034CF5F4F